MKCTKALKNLIFIVTILAIIACSGTVTRNAKTGNPEESVPGVDSKTLIMYGSEQCGLCIYFKEEMDRDKIKYVFYDIYQDAKKKREMWELISKHNPGLSSVSFPIINLRNGKIHIGPDYKAFQKKLK